MKIIIFHKIQPSVNLRSLICFGNAYAGLLSTPRAFYIAHNRKYHAVGGEFQIFENFFDFFEYEIH